jgi:trehalose-phosphatase
VTLDDALDGLAAHVRDGRRVLVALDFDGVLAPLQDDPAASRALPEAVRSLEDLATVDGVELALVSGRALADLASLAHVPDGTHLVGSHGAEHGLWRLGRLEHVGLDVDPAAAALLEELATALVEASRGSTARVEHKPGSAVLHTRGASSSDAERLTAAALELGDREGVDAIRGKDVVELSVLRRTKGDALADLREELAVDALLYAGDDVTDERAFATLGPADVTVRVGPGATAARFRVEDPHAVAALLERLSRLLTSNG